MVASPRWWRAESSPARFAVYGPLSRTDLAGLTDRVSRLLQRHQGQRLDCDVAGVPADAVTVEALARLRLAARRQGCQVRLRNASAELLDLVDLMGLGETLGTVRPGTDRPDTDRSGAELASGVESRRQPEQREKRLGAEEER